MIKIIVISTILIARDRDCLANRLRSINQVVNPWKLPMVNPLNKKTMSNLWEIKVMQHLEILLETITLKLRVLVRVVNQSTLAAIRNSMLDKQSKMLIKIRKKKIAAERRMTQKVRNLINNRWNLSSKVKLQAPLATNRWLWAQSSSSSPWSKVRGYSKTFKFPLQTLTKVTKTRLRPRESMSLS